MRRVLSLALPLVLLAALVGACSDKGNGDDATQPAGGSPTATPDGSISAPPADSREPALTGHASAYGVGHDEMPGVYRINEGETYDLDDGGFITFGPFRDIEDGEAFVAEHGYVSGYQVLFEPDGLLAGVLEGRYYATILVHVFETPEGATAGYERYVSQTQSRDGTIREDAPSIGNQSSAWSIVLDTVGDSDVPAQFHQLIFRRGNLLAVVRTFGAEQYLTVNAGVTLAGIIDERALGDRPAEEPTPLPTPALG